MIVERPLGPLIVGIAGTRLDAATAEMLLHPAVGGVILFSRNFDTAGELALLTAELRALRSPRLLIAVDQEGGRVQRFREGFTPLPPLAALGRWYTRQPDRACDLAYRHGRVMAAEVLGHGLDLSLAPVLDLGRGSAAIGDRALSTDPDAIVELASWYVAGMKDAGMRNCGKHFPGHGTVAGDTHDGAVVDERARSELVEDLQPFARLTGQLDSIMMAHVCYPRVDAQPAGYSSLWIKEILRGELGYTGLILSDDLDMSGAAEGGDVLERAQKALAAGCDAALVCRPESVQNLLATEQSLELATGDAGLEALYGRAMSTLAEQALVPEFGAWRDSLKSLARQSKMKV